MASYTVAVLCPYGQSDAVVKDGKRWSWEWSGKDNGATEVGEGGDVEARTRQTDSGQAGDQAGIGYTRARGVNSLSQERKRNRPG